MASPEQSENPTRSLRVLTLTPFYPAESTPALGCFVAEPWARLEELGIAGEVVAVQSWADERRHGRRQSTPEFPCEWVVYPALPSRWGLPIAGWGLSFELRTRQTIWRGESDRGNDSARRATSRRIDVVHAHSALPCGYAAMRLARKLGVPFVVHVHGLDAFADVQVTGWAGHWCHELSAQVYREAARVLCVSHAVQTRVEAGMAGNVRTEVVYNGADPDLFAPAAGGSTSEEPGQTPVILSVGNLIPIKGHDQVIRAVAAVQSEFFGLRLEVVGEGSERQRLEDLAKKLKVAVEFLGQLTRAEVAERMRQATIFALPSRYEALGCVYLEAMACAKPVIGCLGQGIAEVVWDGENGCLVPARESGEPAELAQGLRTLLRHASLRQRIGQAARQTVMEHFTVAHQAARWAEIYREVYHEANHQANRDDDHEARGVLQSEQPPEPRT